MSCTSEVTVENTIISAVPAKKSKISLELLDRERQNQQKPTNQQAVGLVMGDVFEAISILGIIEAVVFDFPTTLGHEAQRLGTNLAREVREPAVPVATHEFTLPARAQAAALGRPDFDAVYVQHPIQDQTATDIEVKTEIALAGIVSRLVEHTHYEHS